MWGIGGGQALASPAAAGEGAISLPPSLAGKGGRGGGGVGGPSPPPTHGSSFCSLSTAQPVTPAGTNRRSAKARPNAPVVESGTCG